MLVRDRQLLRAFSADRSVERFQPLLDRYLPFVFSTACRRLGGDADAALATRAAFLALARRLPGLSRKTVLAGWLFEAVSLACRKLKRTRQPRTSAVAPAGQPAPIAGANAESEARLALLLDPALARLSRKHRNPVLLRCLLNWSLEDAALVLRRRPRRTEQRVRNGLRKLQARLRRRGLPMDTEALASALIAQGCATPLPDQLASEILESAASCLRRTPKLALARSILRGLTWARWKRGLKRLGAVAGVLALVLASLVASVVLLWRSGWLLPRIIEVTSRLAVHHLPELAKPAQPWPTRPVPLPTADAARTSDAFYRATNIWQAHLRFSSDQWKAVQPKRVPALGNFMQPDGMVVLRNPNARRNGVAGVLGFDYEWAHADLEFSGTTLNDVAARMRGNGTYVRSLWGAKRPFKVDVNKFEKEQEWAGIHTLNFLNFVEDRSYMSDMLGHDLFRQAGVPSPRTAYAWLNLSVTGQFQRKPLGLYLLVENVDADFAFDRFGSKKTPIFKPVTPELFRDLGNDWSAYSTIYALKTKATPAQKQRLIEFARLVTHADDAEFSRRVPEFLDLDETSRFLAALVLVANYDSILTYGQNYFLYLDPHTERFGFIPWDLDQAWGSFPQFGSAMARERASIWHPWAMRNRFLERLLRVEEFRRLYRQHLEELLATAFRPERLYARIDEIAPVIRDAIAAESTFRLRLFDQAISTSWLPGPRDGGEGLDRPAHQIKRFIVNRAKSVRAQLDGRSKGLILQQNTDWGM
jgi:spore coat protein H